MRFLFLGLLILVVGCHTTEPNPTAKATSSAEFQRLAADYLQGYLAWRPGAGVSLGLHEYDGRTTDLSAASIRGEVERLKSFERQLSRINPRQLPQQEHLEYRVLKASMANELFGLVETEGWRNNPMTYAGAISVDIYIKRDFAPLEQRVRSLISIERQAPALFAAARANLEPSLAKPLVEIAIQVAQGSAAFLAKDLVVALKDLKNPSLLKEFQEVNAAAIQEINAFVEYLQKEKLPKANNRYAIGREKYVTMLRGGELVNLTPEEILAIGLKQLEKEKQQFADTARLIDPSKTPQEVYQLIQRDHPTAAGLIPDTKKNLEAIRQFLVDKNIITMPSEVRVRVEETPQFARATSFASMDTAGPFETKATESYYYVTPVEPEWPAEQQEQWLTAFNYYTTDVVSIHEAYPGHYTQFLHLNASKASKLQKMLTSYAFVEGWAHYTELMMLDEGFAAPGPSASRDEVLRAAKYRLAQLAESLLRLCRLCVSIKMHCQGLSYEEGTKFFMANCYYEEKPARQEAMRGTYDPGYLYYTLGKLQILKLREDWRRQEGANYSLRRFHDEFLRHGAPPVPLLRELMLKDPTQWPAVL